MAALLLLGARACALEAADAPAAFGGSGEDALYEVVACGDGDVELVQIQMPGAKRMNARDYLRGHTLETGVCLGRK